MDFTQAINIADIFVLLVKHKEFINLNISKQLINKDVLDFCGLLEMKS